MSLALPGYSYGRLSKVGNLAATRRNRGSTIVLLGGWWSETASAVGLRSRRIGVVLLGRNGEGER